MLIKILLLCIFFAVMIGIGVYTRKHATNVDGFVLGSRSAGPWISAFAYGTSYFSAVVFVGYAGQFGWKYGISSTWIGIGNAVIGSLLAWFVLGRRTRVMTQHIDAKTMPDYFGKRYSSNALKIAASIITFIFLIRSEKALHHCRFAGTIFTHQSHNRPALEIQIDMIQYSVPAKILAHAAYR